jgi:formiminotetrahydrofolate cyclodeaminase
MSGIPEHNPTSGSAAAFTVALAAAIVIEAAAMVEPGKGAAGFIVQAENLRLRAAGLVDQSRDHYGAARQALEDRITDPGYRDHRIGTAMEDTLATLGVIAGTGADTAALAAEVAEATADELRPDAASAAMLAESGVRVATVLIKVNLLVSPGSDAIEKARGELASATDSSRRARESLGLRGDG